MWLESNRILSPNKLYYFSAYFPQLYDTYREYKDIMEKHGNK